jgi:thymidylate synthase ThyX
MDFNVKVVLDSEAPNKARLTTLEVTMPRFLLAQLNTHRQLSRNAASSRAIPTAKMVERILQHPFVPEEWGTNQKGMQAGPTLSGESADEATKAWLGCRDAVVDWVQRLHDLGVHKQLANRLLEPFMWVTVIVSSTEWANFFNLRCHEDAQPQLQKVARMMSDELAGSRPKSVDVGQWHLPYIQEDERMELPLEVQQQCSVARCARVSYLTHDGKRDIQKDTDLYERLLGGSSFGHWSPFEHVATPRPNEHPDSREGNFRGWVQFRKTFPNECQSVWPWREVTTEVTDALQTGPREPSLARL